LFCFVKQQSKQQTTQKCPKNRKKLYFFCLPFNLFSHSLGLVKFEIAAASMQGGKAKKKEKRDFSV
jgi:hypothetical protein